MTKTETIKVKQGSKLNWIVRASGFQTQSGTIDSVMEHTSFPVYLIGESSTTAKLKINPTPSNATIIINEVEGGEKDIVKGTMATYTVSADRYFPITETTDRMYNDLEIPVELYGPLVLLKIQTNKDGSVIKIDGEECSEKWILQGTTANYEISLTNYETISGTTEILNEDTTLGFTMRKTPYDLRSTGEWTASGDKSGFSISSSKESNINWTMTPTKRAMLYHAYVQTNYWNSSYYGRIDIHFKDGTSWKSDSQGSSTSTVSNTTYPSFTSSHKSGSGTNYKYYYQSGTCNPLKELSYLSFHHWHFSSSSNVDTSAYISSLTGYWANTLTINTNVPATITIDNITKTDVSTYEYLVIEDELDNTREIEYRIEAEGYIPQSGTIIVSEDKTLDIVLAESVNTTE